MFSTSGGGGGDGGGASVSTSSPFGAVSNAQLGIGGGTSVYPPQPYAPLASTSIQQQPQRQFSRTNSSTNLHNGNGQGGPSNPPTPQVATFVSPSVKSTAKMEHQAGTAGNGSTSASANTAGTRKRGPSTSPGAGPSETKDKKARPGEQNESGNGATHTRTTSSVNGAPAPDGRHWGEEANKLDVYVWDYLSRRGFHRAAKNLLSEAGLTGTPDVPLKTPQGLLFEYWGVFWDVFAARSGRGSADATTYYDVQEQKLANKINETARRSESMESQFNMPTLQTRFPQILVNAQQNAHAASSSMHTPVPSVGRPVNGQVTTQASQATPVSQAQQQPQQAPNFHNALGRPSGAPQQPAQSPIATATPQQQAGPPHHAATQQLLMLAAQRHNVPMEEIDKLNPQMRAALIQSVAAGAQGQSILNNVRPGPGPLAGNASPAAPGIDAAAFQRMQQQQQQQALQRQMQRGNPQQPLRPGMMGVMQGQQPGGPGTPGMDGVADGRRSAGPQQGQAPGPLQQQNAQGQPFGPQSVQRPAPMRPVGANDGQAAPRLSTEQHQILINQYASLQQTLRQEMFQIENAPTMEVKQRATHSAGQTQMRLQQLHSILKAQPNLQEQAGTPMPQQPQQIQQPRPMQARPPGQPQPQQMSSVMQGNAVPFRPGMTPQQQQQQLMYAQQQQQQQQQQLQQQQQRMSQAPGTPQQGNRGMPGMPGNDPSVMMAAMGSGAGNGMNGQPQQSPQQGNNDMQQQQRGQFAFANPFAAGAGQVGTPGSMHSMRRPSGSQDAGDSSFQQPYAAQTPRPTMPQRVLSGMGPPGSQHMSSPSPRLPQGAMLQQDGSIVGSPATIPSTPRATGAASGLPGSATGGDKKKKDARSRKNSKAVSAANKTPILGAASVPGATPTAQAQTPASINQPTPGPDQNASRGANDQQAQNMSGQPSSVFGTPGTMSSIANVGSTNIGNLSGEGANQSGQDTSGSADGQNSAANNNASATDDIYQMFNGNQDYTQFLDLEFESGASAFGGASTSNEVWDSGNLGDLFADNIS